MKLTSIEVGSVPPYHVVCCEMQDLDWLWLRPSMSAEQKITRIKYCCLTPFQRWSCRGLVHWHGAIFCHDCWSNALGHSEWVLVMKKSTNDCFQSMSIVTLFAWGTLYFRCDYFCCLPNIAPLMHVKIVALFFKICIVIKKSVNSLHGERNEKISDSKIIGMVCYWIGFTNSICSSSISIF